jgi:hypothetical protein
VTGFADRRVTKEWSDWARKGCEVLTSEADDSGQSLGIKLLAELRTVFGDGDYSRLSSGAIVDRLRELPESPWRSLRGLPGLLADAWARYPPAAGEPADHP